MIGLSSSYIALFEPCFIGLIFAFGRHLDRCLAEIEYDLHLLKMSGRSKRFRKTVLHGITDEDTLQQSTLREEHVIRRHEDARGRVSDQVVAAEVARQVRQCRCVVENP